VRFRLVEPVYNRQPFLFNFFPRLFSSIQHFATCHQQRFVMIRDVKLGHYQTPECRSPFSQVARWFCSTNHLFLPSGREAIFLPAVTSRACVRGRWGHRLVSTSYFTRPHTLSYRSPSVLCLSRRITTGRYLSRLGQLGQLLSGSCHRCLQGIAHFVVFVLTEKIASRETPPVRVL